MEGKMTNQISVLSLCIVLDNDRVNFANIPLSILSVDEHKVNLKMNEYD